VYVGEAYYRGNTTPESTKNKQVWNSPATQKGLRCKAWESVIGKMESVPFLDSIYPYIVGDMLNHYGDGLVGCSLKTIWFCCRSRLLARRDYRDEIARNVLFCPGGNALSALCPSDASAEDYRNAMQTVIPEDSIAVVKYWQQLNIIMRVAEESNYIQVNPIPALLPEISNRASKELRNLRNMLTKKTFTFEEEARILAYVREEGKSDFGTRKALLFEEDSTLLLGPIQLFTGMSTREVCALTWGDFETIPDLKVYRLLVYKFLSDEGTVIYHADGTACRKVPVAPLLADMLNSRRTYLQAVCGFTEAELQHLPVIMPDNKKTLAVLSKPLFCKYDAAIRVCRSLIEKADIPTQELVLPGDGDKEIAVDMNKYQGDIFYSNFKHRANHTCSFNRGELSYVVGNKAPDTFSQHYCDYTNDLVQYGMVQKLNRWTHNHETGVQNAVQNTSETSTFTRNTAVHSDRKKNHYNAVSITLSSTQEMPGSYIDVLIECDHGATGSIAVYGITGKEDVQ
jgi:integrase